MKQQALMAALALGATAAPVQGHAQMAQQRPTIVLVHGGFVDGSGWQGVYKILRKDGYTVRIVQNPTISLAGDVAATRLIVDAQEGRVLLVGHSYGGAVITEAGNDPKVAGLVYITAFAPSRRAGPADTAAPGRLLVPRPCQIRRIVRRGRERGDGRIHG